MELFSTLCGSLEGSGVWGRMDTCLCMAESLCYSPEIITALLICYVRVGAKLLQLCPILCDPMDYSPPGSSVHGILHARTLEWTAMPFLLQGIFLTQGSNLSLLGLWHWQTGSLPLEPPGKPPKNGCENVCVLSHVRLCDPMDYSLPGSSVHGISQARILKWAVISFSRGSSSLRDWTFIACVSCISRQVLYHLATCTPIKNKKYKKKE